jgi:TRAP-type mannitol/chloroaromatic compound transport system permease small subunit
MSVINAISKAIHDVNDWVGRMVSLLVIPLAGLLLMETVMRYVFNSPTLWAGELTQMLFGAFAVLAGGYVLRWEGHVTVDIVYSRLPPRVKRIVDIVTSPLFFMFCGVLLYVGGSMAWDSLTTWEHSESAWNPPVYPVKMMIPLGALLLFLEGLTKLANDILGLIKGPDTGSGR